MRVPGFRHPSRSGLGWGSQKIREYCVILVNRDAVVIFDRKNKAPGIWFESFDRNQWGK